MTGAHLGFTSPLTLREAFGVCASECPSQDVSAHDRIREGARFKRRHDHSARDSLLNIMDSSEAQTERTDRRL